MKTSSKFFQGLGLAIGASLVDVKKATTLASVTVMTFMLASGFFVKVMTSFVSFFFFFSLSRGPPPPYDSILKIDSRI